MTAWETHFSLDELKAWHDSSKDPDLKARIKEMIECLGDCISNTILVTVTQHAGGNR